MNEHRLLIPDLDGSTIAQLDRLADARGVTREVLAGDALRQFAAAEADVDRRLAQAADEFARGDFLTTEELMAQLRQWRIDRTRQP